MSNITPPPNGKNAFDGIAWQRWFYSIYTFLQSVGVNGLATPKNANGGGLVPALVVKSIGGTLFGMTGYNTGGAQFIQIHDAAAIPANGALPVISEAISPSSGFNYDPGTLGRVFTNGIVICSSSTLLTLTLSGSTLLIDAQYT